MSWGQLTNTFCYTDGHVQCPRCVQYLIFLSGPPMSTNRCRSSFWWHPPHKTYIYTCNIYFSFKVCWRQPRNCLLPWGDSDTPNWSCSPPNHTMFCLLINMVVIFSFQLHHSPSLRHLLKMTLGHFVTCWGTIMTSSVPPGANHPGLMPHHPLLPIVVHTLHDTLYEPIHKVIFP